MADALAVDPPGWSPFAWLGSIWGFMSCRSTRTSPETPLSASETGGTDTGKKLASSVELGFSRIELSSDAYTELSKLPLKVHDELKVAINKLTDELAQKNAELSRAAAEVRFLRSSAAQDAPEKAPLSASEAQAVRKIKELCKYEDSQAQCSFVCLDAKQLMDYPGHLLPKYQDLLETHPTMLVPFTISFAEACAGVHVKSTLAISHRWMSPEVADIDGVQLAAIRKFLKEHPEIERVWVDYSCMPQGKRTAVQTADLRRMLSQVNLLYLGATVLILLDLSYLSRFWTQLEAWLSMQQATTGRMSRATGTERREHIVTIYNGTATAARLLEETWANVTPEQTIEVLGQPDVMVTNQKDKWSQIERLKVFSEHVNKVNMGGFMLVMAIERAVGRKPKDVAWEDEFPEAMMERDQLLGVSKPRSDYEEGGVSSVAKKLLDFADAIQWQVDNGWPREQASAYTVISSCASAPLAAAVRERSARYAASTHVICETLTEQARRLTTPAPPVYRHLTGVFGLANDDPAWGVLLRSDTRPGLSFVTNARCIGQIPNSNFFPDDQGFYVAKNVQGVRSYHLQDSDVVCIRSAPNDSSYHSMIRGNHLGTHYSPPLTTVTLEKVEEPGEWEANGHRIKRRLYIVSVSYR